MTCSGMVPAGVLSYDVKMVGYLSVNSPDLFFGFILRPRARKIVLEHSPEGANSTHITKYGQVLLKQWVALRGYVGEWGWGSVLHS